MSYYTYDPAKDRRNRANHDLSLALAALLEWDEALVWVDERYAYDELRMIGLVPKGDRIYYVAFIDRERTVHVISLRYATRREVNHYAQTYG